MKKSEKKSKLKAIPYRWIDPNSDEGKPVYTRLIRILQAYHEETRDARFALAWHLSWKPDVDGKVTLGMCRKVAELDREIAGLYDFIIILNKKWWTDPLVTDAQRDAVLDHECCHASVRYDANGEPAVDERGRTMYRIRHHDIEDFEAVVRRHGCYKADIESFMQAVHRAEAGAQTYIGYTRLSELLATIGLSVAPRIIASWSDDERREVHTFALLRQAADEKVNVATSQTVPACLTAAMARGNDAEVA